MKKRMGAALALLAAASILPVPASAAPGSASEAGAVLATVAGVVVGGAVASAVAAGTTATIVGAALGGGIACWWYGDADTSDIAPLPKKAALGAPPVDRDGMSRQDLSLAAMKR